MNYLRSTRLPLIAFTFSLLFTANLLCSRYGFSDEREQYDIDFVFFDAKRAQAFNRKESFEIDFVVKEHAQNMLSKEIVFQVLPSERVWISLRSDKPTCTPAKLKTRSRLDEFWFSLPTGITASSRIFTRRKATSISDVLNDHGEIRSLAELANHVDDFLLFHTRNRSYGNFMDQQISSLAHKFRQEIVSSTSFAAEVKLFLASRSSYLVATPILLHRAYPDVLKEFENYRLENSPSYSLGHIMCNDTPESREFIKEFNTALEIMHANGVYTQIQLDAYPLSLHAEMNDLLDESGLRKSLHLKDSYN
jgi:ABC-type amino acid transport substrate-binding protein